MVSCLRCQTILTILNVTRNEKQEDRCTTEFSCPRCGSEMRVIQLLTKSGGRTNETQKNF